MKVRREREKFHFARNAVEKAAKFNLRKRERKGSSVKKEEDRWVR